MQGPLCILDRFSRAAGLRFLRRRRQPARRSSGPVDFRLPRLELLEDRRLLAAFVVNSTADLVDATPLGDGVVAWVGYIESTPIESLRERLRVLQLLQMAVVVAPNNPRVMAMVADHVLATADEKDEQVSA